MPLVCSFVTKTYLKKQKVEKKRRKKEKKRKKGLRLRA